VESLARIAKETGARVSHVKPHGALYNLAARDARVAAAIAQAVADVDANLWLYGLAGGQLLKAGRAKGLRVVAEVFADRTYQADGSLTSRERPDALLADDGACIAQVLRLILEGRVNSTDGGDVVISAETLCLHGDGAHAVQLARGLRRALQRENVVVRAPG
jgi:5-oxoprolinase (ATP-hydrolysing) subunit A